MLPPSVSVGSKGRGWLAVLRGWSRQDQGTLPSSRTATLQDAPHPGSVGVVGPLPETGLQGSTTALGNSKCGKSLILLSPEALWDTESL